MRRTDTGYQELYQRRPDGSGRPIAVRGAHARGWGLHHRREFQPVSFLDSTQLDIEEVPLEEALMILWGAV